MTCVSDVTVGDADTDRRVRVIEILVVPGRRRMAARAEAVDDALHDEP
jgi:hypothetical protein